MSTPDHPTGSAVVTVERLVAGGDGLARLDDGRVAFVAGGLPGELLEIDIVDDRRDFVRARVGRVVEASGDRRVAPCAHRRAGCGGCDWMELDELAQVEAKVGIVREALRRTARLDASVVEELVSFGGSVGPFGWRTTVRVVGTGDGVGFRRSGSNDVVPIDSCPVAHDLLQPMLATLALPSGDEAVIRGAVASGDVAVAPFGPAGRRPRGPGRRGDRRRADRRPGPASTGDGRDEVPVGVDGSIVESVAGVSFRVSHRSFFQSGVEAAELLVAEVAGAAPELAGSSHVIDLYGGVGLFAATVARHVDHVTLVESSASACADARANLGARSANVVRSDVGDWATSAAVVAGRSADRPADVVIADPARPGLARPGVRTVAAIGAPVVVLVSCDPVSGARDLALLGEQGYRCDSIRVLDLFPQTHHVEMVARFVRGPTDSAP